MSVGACPRELVCGQNSVNSMMCFATGLGTRSCKAVLAAWNLHVGLCSFQALPWHTVSQ